MGEEVTRPPGVAQPISSDHPRSVPWHPVFWFQRPVRQAALGVSNRGRVNLIRAASIPKRTVRSRQLHSVIDNVRAMKSACLGKVVSWNAAMSWQCRLVLVLSPLALSFVAGCATSPDDDVAAPSKESRFVAEDQPVDFGSVSRPPLPDLGPHDGPSWLQLAGTWSGQVESDNGTTRCIHLRIPDEWIYETKTSGANPGREFELHVRIDGNDGSRNKGESSENALSGAFVDDNGDHRTFSGDDSAAEFLVSADQKRVAFAMAGAASSVGKSDLPLAINGVINCLTLLEKPGGATGN